MKSLSTLAPLLLLLALLFFATSALSTTSGEPTVEFDVAVFPTITNDLDPRSYYQGTIRILECTQQCVSASWNLTLTSTDADGNIDVNTVTQHVDNTKGSLTSWSYYLNSESLCTNTAPSTHPAPIQFCSSQQIDDRSEFSGQIRWLKDQKALKPIKFITFHLAVVIFYDDDGDRDTDPIPKLYDKRATREVVYVENAATVDYLSMTKKSNFQYAFSTSFRATGKTNHFALRPFGALSHELLEALKCEANGVPLSDPIQHFVGGAGDVDSKSMYATYLMTLQPHQVNRWIPYTYYHSHSDDEDHHDESQQQHTQQPLSPLAPHLAPTQSNDDPTTQEYFSFPADSHIAISCTLSHPSRFYADELPFGLAVSLAYFPTEKTIDPADTETITTLLTKSPMFFIPRFNVYNQVAYSKEVKMAGVYYSGTYPRDGGYYGDLSVDLDISANTSYNCSNPTGQTQGGLGALLLSVFKQDSWKITGARYMAVGYGLPQTVPKFVLNSVDDAFTPFQAQQTETFIPFYYIGDLLAESESLTKDGGVHYFEPINLCTLFDLATLQPPNQPNSRPIRLTLQISGRYTGSTKQFPFESEYTTPGGLSAAPFNVLATFRQTLVDTEKRVVSSLQPLAGAWPTLYQLLVAPKRTYPAMKVVLSHTSDDNEGKTSPKYDNDVFTFNVGIEALTIDVAMFVLWFPSGNWGFLGDFTKSCDIYTARDGPDWDTSRVEFTEKLDASFRVLDFNTKRSAIAITHPDIAHWTPPAPTGEFAAQSSAQQEQKTVGKEQHRVDVAQDAPKGIFTKGTRWVFRCHEGFVKNATKIDDHQQTDISLSIFALTSSTQLNTFLSTKSPQQYQQTATTTPSPYETMQTTEKTDFQIRVEKAVSVMVPSYHPRDLPAEPSFVITTPGVDTTAHFTQASVVFPQSPKSHVVLIVVLVICAVLIIAILVGIFLWRRNKSLQQQKAFMAYVDVYNDSVQEYM